MDFLTGLFWLPLNSMYILVNIGLWALVIWGIYEALRKYKIFK